MKNNKRITNVFPLLRGSFLPSIHNRIGGIYKSSAQLQSLVNQWLDFQEQEIGHIKLKVSHNDMVAFLKERLLDSKKYAQSNDVQLQFVASEETIDMWFDSKQMQKVIGRLLSRAIKHTPRGGTITLSVSQEIDKATISIKNIGKEHEGRPMDLALAKGIIELHGGRICVESKEEGAILTFCLPLGYAHYRLEELRQESIPRFRMLIIEDDKELRTILVNIFAPFYIIEQASDGQEGLGKIAVSQPDIILSNVQIPLMTGIELCRRVKTDISTSHIPVVLFSVSTSVDNELEGLKYGADGYIVKPFNVNVLLAKCQNLIKLRITNQGQLMKGAQTTTQINALSPMDQEFVNKGMDIVEENLANPKFSISMFAQKMGMSRSAFFNKWKILTDQSPNDYIIDFRLKRASILLKENPELNITEISEITGFNSVGYFGRVFKEKFEMTPSAFRKKEKSKDN